MRLAISEIANRISHHLKRRVVTCPQAERLSALLDQHLDAANRSRAARSRFTQEFRLPRIVHEVIHNRFVESSGQHQWLFVRAWGHACRRCVHDQINRCAQLIARSCSTLPRKWFSPRARAIADPHAPARVCPRSLLGIPAPARSPRDWTRSHVTAKSGRRGRARAARRFGAEHTPRLRLDLLPKGVCSHTCGPAACRAIYQHADRQYWDGYRAQRAAGAVRCLPRTTSWTDGASRIRR